MPTTCVVVNKPAGL